MRNAHVLSRLLRTQPAMAICCNFTAVTHAITHYLPPRDTAVKIDLVSKSLCTPVTHHLSTRDTAVKIDLGSNPHALL